MRATLLCLLLVSCGGSKKPTTNEPPSDNNSCPLEMGIDPQEPTTTTALEVQAPDKPGATYNWTVSSGTIKSGQGTYKIVVEGAQAGKFSATVALGNFGKTCPPTATATVDVK